MATPLRNFQIRALTIALVVLAALFVIVGIAYFTIEAKSLPWFFPGHKAGLTHKHAKHGLAMMSLAALALIGAWFSTVPSESAR